MTFGHWGLYALLFLAACVFARGSILVIERRLHPDLVRRRWVAVGASIVCLVGVLQIMEATKAFMDGRKGAPPSLEVVASVALAHLIAWADLAKFRPSHSVKNQSPEA